MDDSEAIDLSGSGASCMSPQPFPVADRGFSSLKTINGNPLACGGNDYNSFTCWEYQPGTDSWTEGPDLLYYRADSPSCQVIGDNYWVLGGSSKTDTSEVYLAESGIFTEVPTIPDLEHYRGDVYSCSTKISDDLSFYAHDYAYLYNWTTREFTPTWRRMPSRSYQASCGYAESSTGERMVVVAGGHDYPLPNQVQILDLDSMTWVITEGDLPVEGIFFGTVVPYENTFLIVGGETRVNGTGDYAFLDTILQFDPEERGWIVRPERLSTARRQVYAALVEDDVVNCGGQ